MRRFPIRAVVNTAIVLLLLLFTSCIRVVWKVHDDPLIAAAEDLTIFFIYIGMIALWGVSLAHRIMHRRMKGYLFAIVACMMLWIFARTCKNVFFNGIEPWTRLLWYGYYIPMILIPLLTFLAMLCIGEEETWCPDKRLYLFFIPAVLLMVAVLTNDLHQYAFFFPTGDWNDGYQWRVVYYLAALWILGFFLAAIFLLYRKCRIAYMKKRVWLPLAAVGLGVVYSIFYLIENAGGWASFIEMTAMLCAVIVAVWESCMGAGLVPTNSKYRDFFYASPISAQITDLDGTVKYASHRAGALDAKVFERLKRERAFQPDQDTVMHAAEIQGGYVIWQMDISALTQAICQLKAVEAELENKAQILQEEIHIQSEILHLREQKRIYDLISAQTEQQLMQIRRNIQQAKAAEQPQKRRLLQEIGVLGAYVKRYSNLTLMIENQDAITVHELASCFRESIENLKLCGVDCACILQTEGIIAPNYAVLCYGLFENIVEAAMPQLKTLLVALSRKDHVLRCTIYVQGNGRLELPLDTQWQRKCEEAGGIPLCEEQDGAICIALRLPEKAEVEA